MGERREAGRGRTTSPDVAVREGEGDCWVVAGTVVHVVNHVVAIVVVGGGGCVGGVDGGGGGGGGGGCVVGAVDADDNAVVFLRDE